MKAEVKKLSENTPFKVWIMHAPGSQYESNTLPIAKRAKTNAPNMKWAINALNNYRNAEIRKAIFYENGVEFGIYENGRYHGKYQIY